jgi:hypothetical protein
MLGLEPTRMCIRCHNICLQLEVPHQIEQPLAPAQCDKPEYRHHIIQHLASIHRSDEIFPVLVLVHEPDFLLS